MAGYLDLTLNAAESFNTSINLVDVNSSPVNLTNYTVSASMKKSYYTSNIAATFTCVTSNAIGGTINLSMSYQTTSNITPGRYVYDIIIHNTVNDLVTRVYEGQVFVNPFVTSL